MAEHVANRTNTTEEARNVVMRGVNLMTTQGIDTEGREMTDADVKQIADWGMGVIRAGFWDIEKPDRPFEYDEAAFKRVDGCLDLCEKHGLRCVLCMWDMETDWWGMARSPGKIWSDGQLQERFTRLWGAVAERYKDRPTTLYFELMNEPRAVENEDWNRLAREATEAIRAVNQKHTIIVESNKWGSTKTFADLEPTGDPNTIYSFHFYEPIIFTNQQAPWMITYSQFYTQNMPYPGAPPRLEEVIARLPSYTDEVTRRDLEGSRGVWDKNRLEGVLMPAVEFSQKHGVPLFCGEFGANFRAPRESLLNWLRDVLSLFSKHGVSWTYWYYKDMDFGIFDNLRLDHTSPPDYLDRELLNVLLEGIG